MQRTMSLCITIAVGAQAGWLLAFPAAAQAPRIGDPPEAKNMRLVGYNDLQARSAYQPIIHKQGERYIAYIGHHGGTQAVPKPVNPLTGQAEFNGASILDVTDPRQPKYLAHIPGQEGLGEQGGGQMVRACDGRVLPKGDPATVYLLRTFGGQAHEIWNVADPANPKLITRLPSGKDTHKNWWECETGIAYLVSGLESWRTRRMTEIYDLSDPAKPVKIREFGLTGQHPGSTGAVPTELHGAISIGAEGNRVYFAHGTNKGGVLQIVDRERLLKGPAEPTPENLKYPEIGRLDFLPLVGVHTAIPLGKLRIGEFAKDLAGGIRDMIMVVNELLVNECQERETRQMVFFVDATVEVAADGGVELQCPRGGRQFLQSRRALRRAFRQRKHGAGVPPEAGIRDLVQCWSARHRHPRSLHPQGGGLLHPVHHRGNHAALHQGRRRGSLQDRDPEQQRRDRRSRLHLFGRSRQYRPAHPGGHRRGARRHRTAVTAG